MAIGVAVVVGLPFLVKQAVQLAVMELLSSVGMIKEVQ